MTQADTDILMITYNRPAYVQLSLGRLLDSVDQRTRVWVWHNGDHQPTLDVVKSFESHPRFHRLHHSEQNKRLREPTNWFWSQSTGRFVGKVDDDNLMPDGWVGKLRDFLEAVPKLGVLGCWSYMPQDLNEPIAMKKVVEVAPGRRLMRNCWVAGTGHLIRKICIEQNGPIKDKQSFPAWCIQLALNNWVIGWPWPLVYMENLDDPRHPLSELKTEEDFRQRMGLSARQFGVKTLRDYIDRYPKLALNLQQASADPRQYVGWRRRWGSVLRKIGVIP